EFHLVHRLRMRTYRLVTPSPHFDFEAAPDGFAQTRGGVARGIVVVDMRVIATYGRGIDRIRHRDDSIEVFRVVSRLYSLQSDDRYLTGGVFLVAGKGGHRFGLGVE